MAVAGEMDAAMKFFRWLEDGADPDTELSGDFDAMELRADGTLLIWDSSCVALEVHSEYYAIGSGAKAAMSSLYTQARLGIEISAYEALLAASFVDQATAPPFEEIIV